MGGHNLPSYLIEQVKELINQDRKIQAVKVVRETTGWGLVEVKEAVDALAKELEE